jgi:hypothetical protein
MKSKDYTKFWLALVNLRAKAGFDFMDLIDFEDSPSRIKYKGAWANIIVKSKSIHEALEIIPLGLDELSFEVVFIDKIENISSLIKNKEISEEVKAEVDWLMKGDFVFRISDRLFPYK